jgi:hypothetical protein
MKPLLVRLLQWLCGRLSQHTYGPVQLEHGGLLVRCWLCRRTAWAPFEEQEPSGARLVS